MPIPVLRPKNQVTLPARLAEQAGLAVGDPLSISAQDGRIVIERYQSAQADRWLTEEVLAEIDEAARGPYASFGSIEEMNRWLDE
ncbi:MAG: AbrB/MazE/SpoVT family DNA-binding domain-containing protein [Bifidobacteriaceae bacterium]|jgi:bifunctional DNA-binding transcriptional regulator/antitoxin component of YhaV-PrlF toxin-antitoxin module|nr:AbrB/MazE/SpoVT family DNA-binding domain-containing protein [Bifidobacteriaceae bacterium]